MLYKEDASLYGYFKHLRGYEIFILSAMRGRTFRGYINDVNMYACSIVVFIQPSNSKIPFFVPQSTT